MYKHRSYILIALLCIIVGTVTTQAQSPTGHITASNLNVRSGPGEEHEVIATLPYSTEVLLEGRSQDGIWLLVATQDQSVRGWVTVYYVAADIDFMDLPLADGKPQAPAPPDKAPDNTGDEPAQPDAGLDLNIPPAENPSDPRVARLYAVPPTPAHISDRMRTVFNAGQQQGKRANVFSKIGDCHSNRAHFLQGFGFGSYNLGNYTHLQATIGYYAGHAFTQDSATVHDGLQSWMLFDALWSNPELCEPGETPLVCEYRRTRPSVAIALLANYPLDQYEADMRRFVKDSIAMGVIPVLTTFPHTDGGPDLLDLNVTLLDIARDEQIPVINFWLAARGLPNHGIDEDNAHISGYESNNTFISFNGEEYVFGTTMRNLLTLQMLDVIWRTR